MIHLAIAQIARELNAYLNLRSPGGNAERAVAGSLFDLKGVPNKDVENRAVLQIVNVEQNHAYGSTERYQTRADGVHERIRPEMRLNVYVLLIGNLDNYNEALKALSDGIAFFQNNHTFEVSGTNGNGASRVIFDLYSMTFEQQNHLWAALGAKYMPSVLYKAGIVDIRDTQVEAEVAPVVEIAAGP